MKQTNPLIHQLKKLSAIEPNRGFVLRSRDALVGSASAATLVTLPHTRVSARSRYWAFSLAGAIAIVVLILGVNSLSGPRQVFASSLDQSTLTEELDSLSINIQLERINYDQRVNETIVTAIEEIRDAQTNHMSPVLLETEQTELLDVQTTNPEIDELLEALST